MIADSLRFQNLLTEAKHNVEIEHEAKALLCLDEARSLLLASVRKPWTGRPEDDPNRSEADKAAWRLAKG